MKVLVTGSAGHLGEALMRSLRASRHQAIGIDVLPSPFTDATGSIVDRAFVADAMRGGGRVGQFLLLERERFRNRFVVCARSGCVASGWCEGS